MQEKDVARDVVTRWERGESSTMASRIAEGGHREFTALDRKLSGTTGETPAPQEGMRDLAQRPVTEKEQPHGLEGLLASADPHTQAFSSAVYHSIHDVYTQMRTENPSMPKEVAFIRARDAVGSDFGRSLDFMPASRGGALMTQDLCQSMLKADSVDQGGRYRDIYTRNFQASGIDMSTGAEVYDAREEWTRKLGENPALALPSELRTAPDFVRSPAGTAKGDGETPAMSSAQRYLDGHRRELGVPDGISIKPQQLYHNDRGETFIIYSNGAGRYDPKAEQSLVFGFDARGRIIHSEGNFLESGATP